MRNLPAKLKYLCAMKLMSMVLTVLKQIADTAAIVAVIVVVLAIKIESIASFMPAEIIITVRLTKLKRIVKTIMETNQLKVKVKAQYSQCYPHCCYLFTAFEELIFSCTMFSFP